MFSEPWSSARAGLREGRRLEERARGEVGVWRRLQSLRCMGRRKARQQEEPCCGGRKDEGVQQARPSPVSVCLREEASRTSGTIATVEVCVVPMRSRIFQLVQLVSSRRSPALRFSPPCSLFFVLAFFRLLLFLLLSCFNFVVFTFPPIPQQGAFVLWGGQDVIFESMVTFTDNVMGVSEKTRANKRTFSRRPLRRERLRRPSALHLYRVLHARIVMP